MPDNKLTDDEALIAFKNCCLTEDCDNCIAIKKVGNKYDCVLEPSDIVRAFDRLQAENERLETVVEYKQGIIDVLFTDNSKLLAKQSEIQATATTNMLRNMEAAIETAKAEAYKEFADRLDKASFITGYTTGFGGKDVPIKHVTMANVHSILKELVGEDK